MSGSTQISSTAVAAMVPDPITHREYKLLLRSDRFLTPSQFHKFWKLTRRTAKAAGIELRKRGKPMETHLREVLFFDTPRLRLYQHGFMLRRRMFYKKGLPQANHELTLKFRHPDRAAAAAVNLHPLLPCAHTIKFKEEVLMDGSRPGSMRVLYSHACELDTPNIILTQRFESIAQVFPALFRLGASAGTRLGVVNGIAIEEVLVNLGELDFGGKAAARATLAIWRNRVTREQLVGEYSYQLKFADESAFHGKARELSEEFFLALQQDAWDWLQLGTTKTALVYGLGTPAVNDHR